LQIDRKTNRSKDSVSELVDVLQSVKRSEFKDCHLASYKVQTTIIFVCCMHDLMRPAPAVYMSKKFF